MKVKNGMVLTGWRFWRRRTSPETWDNTGLQLGAKDQTVEAVLITLMYDRAVDMALEVGGEPHNQPSAFLFL